MGQIMLISAIVAFCAAGLFLILSGLGLWHLRRATPETEVFPRLATRVQSNAV
jgi:cytochrome oxidase assembly protein ShyY1